MTNKQKKSLKDTLWTTADQLRAKSGLRSTKYAEAILTGRRIQRLCAEGRVPGATKIGSYWAVTINAEKPKDERIKSGKYRKCI